MVQPPLDSAHWYVTEQAGMVKRFDNKSNAAAPITVLDIHEKVDSPATGFDELGLLGIAFHPNFATNHYVYLLYSRAGTGTGTGTSRQNRIARFTASADGSSIDPTETIIMDIAKPSDYHNGGTMSFGPDGYLYIGLGDGGNANDPGNNAQNPTTLLGKMIRIDVDHGSPYSIPADNPNAANPMCGRTKGRGNAACPEIFATGFRNPWKWSFDSAAAAGSPRMLWMGDVGQDHYEEVDLVEMGKNYGWSCREGLHAVDINAARCANIDLNTYTNPINEYGHDIGDSVTGGYVYRGSALQDLRGHYIFGDYVNGYIWYLNEVSPGVFRRSTKIDTGRFIASFAQGNDKELYFLSYPDGSTHKTGQVFALRPNTSAGGAGVPQNLSQTGCVDSNDATKPAAGLIPYAPIAPFWSDGAVKQRWIALPDGTSINVATEGDFEFPNKTVLMKNFALGGQLVETRLFMRHPDGIWAGYSYEWNADGKDATLVDANGKQKMITTAAGTQTWTYPSQADCLRCHTGAAGFSLGPEADQLNNNYGYPPPGKTGNQMTTFAHIGLFGGNPVPDIASLPDPADITAPLDARARAYLHSNCSGCHRPNGPTQSNMDLRFNTAMPDRNICNTDPHAGDAGVTGGKLVMPGSHDSSILYARMHSRGDYQMPPLASTVVDENGSALIAAWIDSLTSCQ